MDGANHIITTSAPSATSAQAHATKRRQRYNVTVPAPSRSDDATFKPATEEHNEQSTKGRQIIEELRVNHGQVIDEINAS
jgi:hypothetical protein